MQVIIKITRIIYTVLIEISSPTRRIRTITRSRRIAIISAVIIIQEKASPNY
jgi:hypothetical protein